jgi:hypothetical protein
MITTTPVRLAICSQSQAVQEMETVLSSLSMQELALHCTREINAFRQTGEGDDQYALEAFRRAVLGPQKRTRDEAWELIFRLFSPLVLSWINRVPGARQLMQEEGTEISHSLLNAIFAKVALTFQRQKEKVTRFTTLAAILAYLRRVTHTVIADELDDYRLFWNFADLTEADTLSVEDPSFKIAEIEHTRMFWRIIEEETFDNELLYLKLSFIQGMKPAEIVATHPGAFSRVEEVYRVRRTALARLAVNYRLRQLRECQQEAQNIG